jgi:hypothetical protein
MLLKTQQIKVMTITNKRTPMNLNEVQEICPSAFTQVSAPNVSSNYTHIPTSRVIEDMISLGWTPVSAQEVRSRKSPGFQKHIIRFQNQNIMIKGNDGDDAFPELLLTNSHDGKNAFHLRVGLFRLVCSNGLVVADAEFTNVSIRHMGYTFDELHTQVTAMLETLPNLVNKINTFRDTPLSDEQMLEFAHKAVALRWKNQDVACDPIELIASQRNQDNDPNLWNVFNRIQEKLINGGISYTNNNKTRKVRALKNFTADINLNSELWQLAEEYVN